jgi:hypothetical protein
MPRLKEPDTTKILRDLVEVRRIAQRISLRTAADRAGMAEATWRQLVAGGVNQGGRWVNRVARRDQVLDMAHAVGALDEAADDIDATPDEVEDTRNRVVLVDPAEEEIMRMRNLRPREKLVLIEQLARLRKEND